MTDTLERCHGLQADLRIQTTNNKMKPTKEQIEAALRHSEYLTSCREKSDTSRTLHEVLAAAYRELLAENEELKEDLHNRIVESFLP
jgi:hypothetical protein